MDFPARTTSDGDIPTHIPLDYDLMSKRANILLGKLLVEAGLVPNPTLEAALKVQELVRDEKISPQQAPEALRKFHGMGASIDEYLGSEFQSEPKKAASGSSSAQQSGGPAKGPAAPKKDAKGAIDLLKQAGILAEADVKTALEVRQKHGGDVVQILVSSGKMDKTTFDAADICLPLIRENKMKVEQCIIALNYCSRSRVSFDAALDELGWPNPRKSK